MAQGDNIQISSHTTNNQRVQNSSRFKAPKAQKSPTFQQLLQCDDSKWSHISSQVMKKNHDEEDEANHHNKKSVLTKVKEKAKKWKINFRKKHSEKNESQCPVTRSGGVGPKDKGEEDADYHSARMYESKNTPSTNTQSLASNSGKHLEKLNTKQNKDEHASFSNTTEPHSKTHEPSNSSVAAAADTDTKNQTSTTDVPKLHEFPETNSRFSGLKVSTSDNSQNKFNKSFEEGETTCKSESHTPDKGVWVKEYLMHKFEPGEDERALSKVITQAISPRRDKMREAMTCFLKNDESSNADNNVNLNFKSKSLPAASTNLETNNTPIKQSHSLGSSASKASMNLNQTFKSTFASYQDHFLSSSSKHNTNVINLPTKTGPSPLGHVSSASGNETKAPAQDAVSHSVKKSQVPSHTATSVRRVPVSRAKQTQDPSHTENNTIQVRPSTGTDCNACNSNSSVAR